MLSTLEGFAVSGNHNPRMPQKFWFHFNSVGIYHYYLPNNGRWITRRCAAILIAEGVKVEKRMWRGESFLPKRKSK